MVTLTIGVFCGVAALDGAGRRLAITVARALDQACRRTRTDEGDLFASVTKDYVARVIAVPRNKLCDQLAGKAPFTTLCRLLASEELRRDTTFHQELAEILAEDLGLALVPRDLNTLIGRVDELIAAIAPSKRMAKAALAETRSIELPLTRQAGAR